jgi:hypothetical protein
LRIHEALTERIRRGDADRPAELIVHAGDAALDLVNGLFHRLGRGDERLPGAREHVHRARAQKEPRR